MIVAACDATLYLEVYNNVLYCDSCTLGAMAQKLAMILMSIALEIGSDAMENA
jgi:hypothetical protein